MNTLIYYILITITLILLLALIYLLYKEQKSSTEIKLPPNLPLTLKAQLWLGENYKIFLIGSLLFILISSNTVLLSLFLKEKQMNLCQETLYEMADKVLILTPDGKVANVELSPIKPIAIKYYFDDRVNDFIISKLCILGKGNSFPTTYLQIPQYCYKAKKILNSGLLSKQGKVYYLLALKAIYALAKADKLPEIIEPQKVESQALLQKQGNTLFYKYQANVEVLIKYLLLGSQKMYQAEGNYKIVIVGRINPEKGNMRNPFGVSIDYIKLEIPLKPKNTE